MGCNLTDALKDHKGLRTLLLGIQYYKDFDPGFSYLRQLLSHNRDIVVKNGKGEIYTDRGSIDELYALNRFHRGSAGLLEDPPLERPLLVSVPLLESASNNFQRTCLLLANHTDVLHELVRFSQLGEELDGDGSRSPLNQSQKRRRLM